MTDYITAIKCSGKPVCVYGMGNGAEKIIAFLASNGIKPSCVFASDGFVRGQSFLGERVLSLSEAEERFGDFIAVSAFALEGDRAGIFTSLAKRHTLFAPNLPPYGEGVADSRWLEANGEKVTRVRSLLADSLSLEIYDSLIEYFITADISCLKDNFTPPDGWYGRHYADIGAYDGDTAISYAAAYPEYEKIYAFEPGRIFSKLSANTAGMRGVECVNAAVSGTDGTMLFSDGKGRGSSAGGGKAVKSVTLDTFFEDKELDAVKIDGEGADTDILRGGVNVICGKLPSLCVAVYHRAYDLFDIPLWIKRQAPSYSLYLRRKKYVPAFDVFLYAIKNDSETGGRII